MGSELKIIHGLNSLGDMIVDALKDEFIAQGHNNTGAFVESLVYAVDSFSTGFALNIYFNKYGVYLDKGVKPDRVPFSMGSGAKRSKFIDALTRWVMQRGFVTSLKQAKSMAFAIAKKQKREGIPTKGSYAYSTNGFRTDFFSRTMPTLEKKIDAFIYELAGEFMFAVIEDSINDTQKYITDANRRAA